MALIGGQVIIGTPVFAVTDSTITINVGSQLVVSLYPDTFDSASSTISVTTDNYTGYTATLTNPNNSTNLIHISDSTLTIPTITLPQGSSSITSNQFANGYGFSTDGTHYVPAPSSASSLSLGSSNVAGTNTHNLTLGVFPVASTPSGSYTKDFNVVALANIPQYSITYNANGGTDTVNNMPSNVPATPTSSSSVTLANNVPTRESYVFLGWDTSSSATTPTYPKDSVNTIDIEPTQANNITLYAVWQESGTVQITDIQYVSGINVSGTPNPSIDNEGNINFDLTFLGGLDDTSTLQATYRLTVTNSTPNNYAFTAPASNLTLRISDNEVRDISYELSGIAAGDTIPARSSVSFNIILSTDYVSGEHSAEGGINVEPVSQVTPSLIGSIYGSNTGDLSGNNNLTSFQISVESTFEESKSFSINSLNSDFEIVDSSGNALGSQTIAAGATSTYTFYMKKANGAAFASETATAGITISYDSTYTNVGEVKITVDKDASYVDSQAPTISSVTITRNNAVDGEATLTWSGTDNVGVASYGIYKCTNTCDNMISVSGLTTSYTFSNLSDGTYHFVVVGFDDEGNTATQNEINGANTDPGPASSTGDVSLSWSYTVTTSITNGSMTNTTGNTARAGGTWEGTISPDNSYEIPSSKNDITVKINGQTTTNFTYNTSSGKITINSGINGPIEITATCPSSGCLIEGTRIAVLDENGRRATKPIEDITYSDWLVVWDHETGTIGYVHPARIEKSSVMPNYQLTTFSDGSTLGTTSWHGIFDVDANEFVSVDDFSRFGVGTRVYKVIDDELTPVSVTSIEYVEQEVNVYYITSSTYYNIISDDFLTTNGYVITSNFYGFDVNITWPSTRAEFIADPNNLYTYADFADIGIPLRMFNDLRLGEAAYLQRYGITLQMFKNYLVSNHVVENMVPYDDE